MGRAAAANPRSLQGKDTEQDLALARLQQVVERMPPVQYEKWLLGFPPFPGLTLDETRAQIRQMTRPFCQFTVEALRENRLNIEAHERLMQERARQVALRDAE